MRGHDRKVSRTAEEDAHWNNYAEYSKTLRTWLVGYGVGGPVLFATNETFSKRIIESDRAMEIVGWFLAGVSLQVGLAFVNKWCAYHQYLAIDDAEHSKSLSYRVWNLLNYHWQIDFLFDAATFATFIWATYMVLCVYVGG